jgi:hypothetical protein
MADLANTTHADESIRPAFEVLPKLPIELRLKIFRTAAPNPRMIELAFDHNHILGRVVQTQASPLLGTSREPREELLKGTRPLWAGKAGDCTVHMKFDRDTLYIPVGLV